MTYTIDQIKEKLLSDDRWLERGLIAIYNRQTADEKSDQTTKHENGRGFASCDAEIMTSMAQQLLSKGYLTANQKKWLRSGKSQRFPNRICKYARQLLIVAEEKKKMPYHIEKIQKVLELERADV